MNTLNKTKIIVPAEHTENVARAIFALKEGVFTKLICGAANTNAKQVERLALVYALSGVNAIDVSPSQTIIQAAKLGIQKASELYEKKSEAFSHFKEPVLMVSIDAGGDLHFRKAKINYNNCTNCLDCIDSCPSKALSTKNSDENNHSVTLNSFQGLSHDGQMLKQVQHNNFDDNYNNKIQLNNNNCFGCGKCSEACLQNAIEFTNLNDFQTPVIARRAESPTWQSEEIKAIEIHTGNNSIKEVKNFLELNVSLLKNTELLSFCVESKRFNSMELQDYVTNLVELVSEKPIVQIDGNPMRATDKHYSSLQTISAAAVLLERNVNAYIQLSGGTNHLTKKLVKQLELKISGIAYGTFARKLILSYLEELDDDNFAAQLQRIVNITTSLVGN